MSYPRYRRATSGLSDEQKRMVQEAIGDEADFPDMTSDPRVNHAVDMIVCGESSWEKLSDKDREIYQEEAKTAQAEGL